MNWDSGRKRRLRLDVDDRVVKRFEEFLDQGDSGETAFEHWLQRHPNDAAELRELWIAHRSWQSFFASVQPSLLAGAPESPALPEAPAGLGDSGRPLRILRSRPFLRWASAVALVVVAGWGVRYFVPERVMDSLKAAVGMRTMGNVGLDESALIDRGLRVLDRVECVVLSSAPDSEADEAEASEAVARGTGEILAASKGLVFELDAKELDPPDRQRLQKILAVREQVREANLNLSESAVEAFTAAYSVQSAPSRILKLTPEQAFILGATLDRDMVRAWPSGSGLTATLRAAVEAGQEMATLRLRAFDLDAGGGAYQGGEVFVQQADPLDGALGEPRSLGPPGVHHLPPGDWRVQFVDSGGQRHSVIRVFLRPGDEHHRVLFLRAEPFGSSAVDCSGGTFSYGLEPDEESQLLSMEQQYHLEARSVTVAPFAIDVYEATLAEFRSFWSAWQSHPEWQQAWSEGAESPTGLPAVKNWPWEEHVDDAICPLFRVPWEVSVVMANWMGKRLPTDREWECFATGGGLRDTVGLGDSGPEKGIREDQPGPVNAPSGCSHEGPWPRVYRMDDNVTEWVEDVMVMRTSAAQPRYFLGSASLARVKRGANYGTAEAGRLVRIRLYGVAASKRVGFRCARSLSPDLFSADGSSGR